MRDGILIAILVPIGIAYMFVIMALTIKLCVFISK